MSSIQNFFAAKRIIKTLEKNPNDVRTILELVSRLRMLPDPNHEMNRKLLNRVLVLDPANQKARLMLLEMDRAGMGAGQAQPLPQVVSEP
ncbi:MAG TPA: hypothetical protein VFQ13_20565, partial [Anaerolineales bacterium]|nr:hypothetical protein [Anaerolineales bacterium]